LQAISWTQ
jgi:hypothetical protein